MGGRASTHWAALLCSLGCAGAEPEPAPPPEPTAGAEPSSAAPSERFLGLGLDTQSMARVSTDFRAGERWSLSVAIGPEERRAAAIVADTAQTVRAFATAVDPIEPLELGETAGARYAAHIRDRATEALGFFGATDEPRTGRVIRIAYQTTDAEGGRAAWAALVGGFGAEPSEGPEVWLAGLRFGVPTDEGRLTLIDPEAAMTIRLRLTREPNAAAALLEAGPERPMVDRQERSHPAAEGAVLTTFGVRDVEGGAFRHAVLVAATSDGRTLVVHASEPDARFGSFLASLRVP